MVIALCLLSVAVVDRQATFTDTSTRISSFTDTSTRISSMEIALCLQCVAVVDRQATCTEHGGDTSWSIIATDWHRVTSMLLILVEVICVSGLSVHDSHRLQPQSNHHVI